jgi:hypothetical protein
MTDAIKNTAISKNNNVVTEPINITTRIGSTTYEVAVHFNNSSKETIKDKLFQLIEQEVENVA